MCTLSNTIKFCTCKSSSTERLQHYWQLYRRNKDKNEFIIGEAVTDFPFIEFDYKTNQTTLVKRINETDAFDIPLVFQDKDILEIVFNSNDSFKRSIYGFKYNKGIWKIHEIDSFYLMGHFDEMEFGKIKK